MNNSSEADVLDVVRRLRKTVNDLDNCNFLINKVKELHDPTIEHIAEKTVVRVAATSKSVTALLKHVEANKQYRDIVKRYRAPNQEQE
jgi:hypothetical protein